MGRRCSGIRHQQPDGRWIRWSWSWELEHLVPSWPRGRFQRPSERGIQVGWWTWCWRRLCRDRHEVGWWSWHIGLGSPEISISYDEYCRDSYLWSFWLITWWLVRIRWLGEIIISREDGGSGDGDKEEKLHCVMLSEEETMKNYGVFKHNSQGGEGNTRTARFVTLSCRKPKFNWVTQSDKGKRIDEELAFYPLQTIF